MASTNSCKILRTTKGGEYIIIVFWRGTSFDVRLTDGRHAWSKTGTQHAGQSASMLGRGCQAVVNCPNIMHSQCAYSTGITSHQQPVLTMRMCNMPVVRLCLTRPVCTHTLPADITKPAQLAESDSSWQQKAKEALYLQHPDTQFEYEADVRGASGQLAVCASHGYMMQMTGCKLIVHQQCIFKASMPSMTCTQ